MDDLGPNLLFAGKNVSKLFRQTIAANLSYGRVQCNGAGKVELKLKTPWHDGTTHIVMSPLTFMQRLAALVPRPRLHLIRFHGVLAPHARLRAVVVPARSDEPAQVQAGRSLRQARAPGARSRWLCSAWMACLTFAGCASRCGVRAHTS